MSEPAVTWLRQAETTLGAMAGMEDFMRSAYLLAKQHPWLTDIFTAFPGAQIVDVRDSKPDDGGANLVIIEEDEGEDWRPTLQRMDV